MSPFDSRYNIFRHFCYATFNMNVTLRTLFLIATSMLTGCQWLPMSDGSSEHWSLLPDSWPWQQESATLDSKELVKRQNIAVLKSKAELAFTKDRLSVPANDNAVMYYREILKLDANNQEALDGLKSVSKRYRKLAIVAHENGNGSQARKYLGMAESISGVNHKANQKLRKTLQTTPQGQNQRALDQPLQEEYKTQKNLIEDNQRTNTN